MAVHEHQFGQLFAAFTNRDVTTEERAKLYELAERDVGRRGALAEVEAVHELLDVEVQLRQSALRPVEPAEEADESYRRLAKAAARAEEKLRANLLHPTTIPYSPGVGAGAARPTGSRRFLYFAVAAVLLIGAGIGIAIALERASAPSLDSSVPDGSRLGDRIAIYVTTEISGDSPEIAWNEVSGATTYAITVVDANETIILQTDKSRSETSWQLSQADLNKIRAHRSSSGGDVFVRVVARDRAGVERGSTASPKRLQLR